MLLLRNPIQPYDWGPVDGIARLVDSEPTGGHEAELWVGTHPRGASVVAAGEDAGRTLAEATGEQLPFLLKVLAIGRSLSLQAHPSADEAAAGFDREEAAGLPLDAPERNYRDRGAKPEVLVALEPTWILCGFRSPEDGAARIRELGVARLGPLAELVEAGEHAKAIAWLLRLDGDDRSAVAEAVASTVGDGRPDDPRTWVARLASQHPGDPTCVAPLVLHVLRLDPGDSVHLPAGNLHAYMEGSGVELMASSDNVLRGGLTTKHVDVEELLRVLDGEPGVPDAPTRRPVGRRSLAYDADEPAFGLVRVDPGDDPVELTVVEPSLLLAVGGEVDLAGPADGLTIGHGDAAYVAAGEGPIAVSGAGTVWWATTGAGLPT